MYACNLYPRLLHKWIKGNESRLSGPRSPHSITKWTQVVGPKTSSLPMNKPHRTLSLRNLYLNVLGDRGIKPRPFAPVAKNLITEIPRPHWNSNGHGMYHITQLDLKKITLLKITKALVSSAKLVTKYPVGYLPAYTLHSSGFLVACHRCSKDRRRGRRVAIHTRPALRWRRINATKRSPAPPWAAHTNLLRWRLSEQRQGWPHRDHLLLRAAALEGISTLRSPPP